jgi:hypothetical protein
MSVRVERPAAPISRVTLNQENTDYWSGRHSLSVTLGHSGSLCFRGDGSFSFGPYFTISDVREFANALLELCDQAEGA